MFHVEPSAIITDKINSFAFFQTTADMDTSIGFAASEFEGIGEKIDDDLLEQSQITKAVGQFIELKFNGSAGVLGAEVVKYFAEEIGEFNMGFLEGLAAEAREVEQIVDHFAHFTGALDDAIEQIASFIRQRL